MFFSPRLVIWPLPPAIRPKRIDTSFSSRNKYLAIAVINYEKADIKVFYSYPIFFGSFRVVKYFLQSFRSSINSFQSSFAFHIETSHLFCSAKQKPGFYMKQNIGLKWVNLSISKSDCELIRGVFSILQSIYDRVFLQKQLTALKKKSPYYFCERDTYTPIIFWKALHSGELPETMRKLYLSTKFPHQKIRWNYGIFRNGTFWFSILVS